jgi:hypothetical protein
MHIANLQCDVCELQGEIKKGGIGSVSFSE